MSEQHVNGNGGGPVLLAYDGSDHARGSIRQAARQLGSGRHAVVLTVWTPLAALPFGAPGAGGADIDDSIVAEAQEVASEGVRLAESVGFAATPQTEAGNPVWRTIVDAADASDASVVVMGSHGRTGVSRLLLGSVAAAVASHTDRPVLITHEPHADDGD
jgi:nucleotide-binding universal stress UspA family protein